MKISYFILAVILLLAASPSAEAQTKRATAKYVITFNSFGPVKIGMTIQEATKALGLGFVSIPEPRDCKYYHIFKGGLGDKISFMVKGGAIARFEVHSRSIATDKGAKVGDSEAQIKRLYKGQYKVSKRFEDNGNSIEVEMKGGEYSIIFETDGKHVTNFRAGRSPEVGYVEGCS